MKMNSEDMFFRLMEPLLGTVVSRILCTKMGVGSEGDIRSGGGRNEGILRPSPGLEGVLRRASKKNTVPVITEIKPSSPSKGELRRWQVEDEEPLSRLVKDMEDGGAAAISVLVEPLYFGGSLELLSKVKKHTHLPVIAKGFHFTKEHLVKCALSGADGVLMMVKILDVLSRMADSPPADLPKGSLPSFGSSTVFGDKVHPLFRHLTPKEFVAFSGSLGMEVVAEVADEEELRGAISSGAKIILVNNRFIYGDLSIDLKRAALGKKIPSSHVFVSASGVFGPEDIDVIEEASDGRVDAVLVGTGIMERNNVKSAVAELAERPRVKTGR